GSVSSQEDALTTQQGLLKSPLILQRAIQKRELTTLRTFDVEKEDALAVLMRNLSASRSKDPSGGVSNILIVSFRGPVPDDCNKILEAVLEAYREVLDETYLHAS